MRKIFCAIIFLLMFVADICFAYAPQGRLYVTMLDVGQGDAFLIETPTQNVLIDCGDIDCSVVDQLQNRGIHRIERVILTHPHADHIGGLSGVLKNFRVDSIYDNGFDSKSPLMSYRQGIIPVNALKADDIIDFGGGVKFKVLWPKLNAKRLSVNNQSIVAKLTFGEFSMLFTGDIEKDVEYELYNNAHVDLPATVLKAAHHGSRTSSTPDFVNVVAPTYVFISAGKRFDHPHKNPLAIYQYNFVLPENIFCTRFNGSVHLETDGKNLIVIPDRADDWVVEHTGEIISVTRL